MSAGYCRKTLTKSLRRIDMSNTSLGDEGAIDLYQGLVAHPISEIVLRGNSISSLFTYTMIPWMPFSTSSQLLDFTKSLQLVDLSQNQIDDQGALDLAILIFNSNSLKILNLGMNKVTDAGVGLLCDVLQNNTTLKVLDLGFNKSITDASCEHLARILPTNSGLEHITLCWNQITSAGVQLLCKSLWGNCTLKGLNLLGNQQITNKAELYISEMFQKNNTLKSLLRNCTGMNQGRIARAGASISSLNNDSK